MPKEPKLAGSSEPGPPAPRTLMAEPAQLDPGSPGRETWEQRIRDLQGLQTGWDGYGAEPPADPAIRNALRFAAVTSISGDLPLGLISPSTTGGIGITFRGKGTREAYLEFYNTGRTFVLLSDGTCEPEILEIGNEGEQFSFALGRIREYLYV